MTPLLFGQDAADGVETVWRLQTHWTWAPWLTVVVVASLVAVVVACYRWEATPAGGAYRALLGLLRLTTIALLLAMLSEAVFSGVRSGLPRLAIVLDRSESMQREDADAVDGSRTSREVFARQTLLRDDARLIRRLAEQYQLELIEASGGVATFAGAPEEVVTALGDGAAPVEDAASTRLGDAIDRALSTGSSAPLQGVLLLTDGQNTSGTPLSTAAEAARRSAVPLYFVGIGGEDPPPEARLTDLVADDTAFVDDLVRFQATLRSRGLEGRRVRVELLRTAPGVDGGERVAESVVAVSEGGQTVRLLHRPTEPGDYRYTLRATVESAATDAPPPTELSHTLRVRDDKVRVLLAAGYPNYEYRYLKHLLERDETIKLQTHLQEADFEYSASDRTALARFPLRAEELDRFDVLVLIDLDPTLLPRSLWGEIAEFVGRRGGGLALVAGPKNLPVAYRGRKAFVSLMPTQIARAAPGGWARPAGFRPIPTDVGAQSPSMQLADDPGGNADVWRTLTPLYWWAEVGPPKPAAQVLATGPNGGDQPKPLIVTQFFGAGRVLLHAMDGTWRWRFRIGDAYFARYWVQSLRDLARSKGAGVDRAELLATKRRYESGEPVRLRFRALTEVGDAAEGDPPAVLLQSPGRADRRVELAPGAGGRGRYRATLGVLPPGKYRAVLASSGVDGEAVAAEFEVVAPPGEAARPEMNREGMVAAARLTRGAFFTPDEVDGLADKLPRGRLTPIESLPPIELWNRWPLLLAVCVCLSLEWILRKRRSML